MDDGLRQCRGPCGRQKNKAAFYEREAGRFDSTCIEYRRQERRIRYQADVAEAQAKAGDLLAAPAAETADACAKLPVDNQRRPPEAEILSPSDLADAVDLFRMLAAWRDETENGILSNQRR